MRAAAGAPTAAGAVPRPRSDSMAAMTGATDSTEASAGGSRSGAQAVERALLLLRLFDADRLDWSISELAAASGLSVSTTHRLAAALRAGGMLDQDPRTERYRLGGLAVALGRRADTALGLPRLVPQLERLAALTGESVNLGMRSGHHMVVLHHVPSSHPLRFDQQTGMRVPVHVSAMGRAVLSRAADLVQEVADLGELEVLNDRTRTGEALVADLREVRARGWAFNDEEREPGVRAIGVALPPGAGVPDGGVAVQGPTVRLTDQRVAELGPEVAAFVARL